LVEAVRNSAPRGFVLLNRRQPIQEDRMTRLFCNIVKTSLVAGAILSVSATALASFWEPAANVRWWTIVSDVGTNGATVELTTSRTEYAFPLNASTEPMLEEIREAKRTGRTVIVRAATNSQYCYNTHDHTNVPKNCKTRLWGIQQVQP
jgi:hypothetical protein